MPFRRVSLLFGTAVSFKLGHRTDQGSGLEALERILSGQPNPIPYGSLADDDRNIGHKEVPPPHSDACHPKCEWSCAKVDCEESCAPTCSAPRCNVQCSSDWDIEGCKQTCEKPVCAVVCPQQTCRAQDDCKECQTICAPPVCKVTCPDAKSCDTKCAKPDCAWNCKKGESCPEPVCTLKCADQKKCPKRPGATRIAIIPGGTVRAEGLATAKPEDLIKLQKEAEKKSEEEGK